LPLKALLLINSKGQNTKVTVLQQRPHLNLSVEENIAAKLRKWIKNISEYRVKSLFEKEFIARQLKYDGFHVLSAAIKPDSNCLPLKALLIINSKGQNTQVTVLQKRLHLNLSVKENIAGNGSKTFLNIELISFLKRVHSKTAKFDELHVSSATIELHYKC
jgi:hypothetical protein